MCAGETLECVGLTMSYTYADRRTPPKRPIPYQ